MKISLFEQPTSLPFKDFKAQEAEALMDQLLERAKAKMQGIIQAKEPRTWENTAAPLDRLTEKLERLMGLLEHLESVLGTPALRAALVACRPKLSAFSSSIALSTPLYQAVKEYAQFAPKLTPARQRFLEKSLEMFRRHGAELVPTEKARLQEIEVKLAKLTTRFSQNVVDATDAFELLVEDEARLEGLPPSALAAARASARAHKQAGWRFSLQAPSYLAVMNYSNNSALREQLYRAHKSRAAQLNRELLLEILKLRAEKAVLLGYKDISDLHLEPRMVKSGERAAAFVEDLREKSEPYALEEHAALSHFKEKRYGGAPIQAWDLGWFAEQFCQESLGFEEEQLRPYFSIHPVLEGLFEICARIFGVQISKAEELEGCHPDVEVYRLNEGARCLGLFHIDLFPRKGKRGGAWMRPLFRGDPAQDCPHVAVVCANLTPPIGDKPALLTHREVETLFHEFGHMLHHLLTEAELYSQAGTNVAWDFVELPSQIMENWCWEREALDLFARHHQTGTPIPEDLYLKLRRSRHFRSASAQMRQLSFAQLDLSLHREFDFGQDVLEFALEIERRLSPTPLPDSYAMVASFNHLFADPVGYAAGYYSYKWAEVLDADAFTCFAEAGIFNTEVGRRLRTEIFAQGDSQDPLELFKQFRGREPDPQALMVRAGLHP